MMSPVLEVAPEASPIATTDEWNTMHTTEASAIETLAAEGSAAPGASTAPPTTIHILYGSEMGNAELVADNLNDALAAKGIDTSCQELNEQELDELNDLGVLLVVVSTCGEGDMPYSADQFWRRLSSDSAPSLENLRFAVLAMGDSGYTYFCEAGAQMDARLAELGATRVADRVDLDVNYVEPSEEWIAARVEQFTAGAAAAGPGDEAEAPTPSAAHKFKPNAPKASEYNRANTFDATLTEARALSLPGSAKQIFHFEIDTSGSGIEYHAGDSVAIVPVNSAEAVRAFLDAAGLSGDEVVDGRTVRALAEGWELRFPSGALLEAVSKRAPESDLAKALARGDHAAGEDWIRTNGVCETLRQFDAPLPVEEIAALMGPVRYRAYSIASTPLTHPNSMHLTVSVQRNGADAALPAGIGSGFLSDCVKVGDTVRLFPFPNRNFRLPEDSATPVIMVGPGVGVAPFRAFLSERANTPGTGPTWLFFGDQHEATDFIYREDWSIFSESGVLTRLDTAFSRDQERKVYVQDRMREHAAELVRWLQDGAYFYVCGDGKRMAADVDRALHEICVAELGAEAGERLMERLQSEKRYLRDIY